jgi:hypothetical protein
MPFSGRPGNAIRTKAAQALCDETHSFFTLPRAHLSCKSKRPSETVVQRTGDFARSWWIRSFLDGTVDLSLQTDKEGCVLIYEKSAEHVRTLKNPLRDPLVVVKRDDMYFLKDGFHRLCEALARHYHGRVWAVVLDMDTDSTSDE